MEYTARISQNQTYTFSVTDSTSEAQIIWIALHEAGWADHPYTVDREDNSLNITSERLAASMRITPRV